MSANAGSGESPFSHREFSLRGFSRRDWMVAAGGGLLGIGSLCGCQTAPMTGRRQLLLVGREREVALGAEAYDQTLQEQPLSGNAAAAEMVRRVGERIAAVSADSGFDWRFELLQSPQQNAFCLPGGKVAVYEGILPVCESEGGLAVVMSHEIAHAIARHGSERMTHSMVSDTVKQGVERIVKARAPDRLQTVLAAYGAASQYGVILPYSRWHETEADRIGILLMADAGYDPAEAPRFWSRFGALGESADALPEFLSTHPSGERRTRDLQELLPGASQRYALAARHFGQGSPLPSG